MSRTDGLRILRVLPFFTARYGGCVSHAHETSRRLAERGHRVRVLTTDLGLERDSDRADRWIEQDGYAVRHLRTTGRWQRVPPYQAPHGADEILARELRDSDVLWLNVGLTLWNRRASRLARRHGVPYAYNAEGALCPVRLRQRRLAKALFLRVVERDLIRSADAVEVVTEKEGADLIEQGVSSARVHCIPNGVTLPDRPDPGERRQARRDLGLEADTVALLFLGRLHPLKGIDRLVDSMPALLRTDPRVRLLIAGPDDGAGPGLQERIAHHGLESTVQLLGMVQRADLRRLMVAADIFALPSASEGLPLAVLEAAALGLPMVLSPECNVPAVERHQAGLIVPRDPQHLTDALQRMVGDLELRKRCAENARTMVAKEFRVDRLIERREAMLRGLSRT